MKVKVSKVFAKAVNEIAEKYGKRFHAEVRKRKIGMWENFCDADFNWETDEVRELVVTYPAEYYACPRYVRTDELLAEFNRRGVKAWAEFEQMIVDMFEI